MDVRRNRSENIKEKEEIKTSNTIEDHLREGKEKQLRVETLAWIGRARSNSCLCA